MSDYYTQLSDATGVKRDEVKRVLLAHGYLPSKEYKSLRAENEALKARERVLVEALEPYSKEENWATGGNGEYDWEEAIYLDQGYEGAKQALSAIPEDVRELYRLEREVIDAALFCYAAPINCENQAKIGRAANALQAHKSASKFVNKETMGDD